MKYRMRVYGAALVVTVATIGIATSGSAAMLDSSLFNHRYEGDNFGAQLTGPNATFNVTAGESPTWNPTVSGGVLEYKNTIADSGAWFDSVEWDTDVNNALGWTVEFRVKIGTDGDEDPTFATFQWFGKENLSSNSTRRAGVSVGKNKVFISSIGTTPVDTNDNTDGFHTFRIAQPANSSTITVWRDTVQIFSDVSRSSNNSGLDMWFGDGSGSYGGPTTYLDYFRWDSTGAYEPTPLPIPEPNSLVLLGMGFVSSAVGVRRKKMWNETSEKE